MEYAIGAVLALVVGVGASAAGLDGDSEVRSSN